LQGRFNLFMRQHGADLSTACLGEASGEARTGQQGSN